MEFYRCTCTTDWVPYRTTKKNEINLFCIACVYGINRKSKKAGAMITVMGIPMQVASCNIFGQKQKQKIQSMKIHKIDD